MDQVNYDSLDRVKLKCIEASKKTLKFASKYGEVVSEELGASANVFAFDLSNFSKLGANKLYMTHLPEGLGTADDARPEDLSQKEEYEFWFNIGTKTISCLTNDAVSSGLQTVLISLYLPSSTPETVFTDGFINGFLDGFVDGCKTVGCVYLSGETPQLKTKIVADRIDIAGGLWGVMPAGLLPITGSELTEGDTIVCLESSGPHENGFTPIRKIAGEIKDGFRANLNSGEEFWRACNKGSKLYTPLIQELLTQKIIPSSIENITGHGWQKIMRSKKPFKYVLEDTLPYLEVFEFIEKASRATKKEMFSIFNCGTGQVLFFKDISQAVKAVSLAKNFNINAKVCGHVEKSNAREVEIKPYAVTLGGRDFLLAS